ncbi:MAG TPA: hypothetical protein VH257_21245, partial [Chloroflexota bacterium]|nr:hypothetical protein [Chloroflexota bacterium]
QSHRLILPQGGEVQAVYVTPDGGVGEAPLGAAFVPETAVPPGAVFLLVEGTPEPTAGAFARRVHEALLAEQGVTASRLIRAVATGCRAVERRVSRLSELSLFGCSALVLESTVQRYAYVSQVPPCQVYLLDGGELTALPEEPMLGAGQPGGKTRNCAVEVDLNRLPFRPGATFLLAPGALGARLSPAAARELLRLPLDGAAAEVRRVLREARLGGAEAILVRVPEAQRASRVRLFAAPVESPGRRPLEEDVTPQRGRPRPGLHKWGLERERRGLGAWLDDLSGRLSGGGDSTFYARRAPRRGALLAGAALALPLAGGAFLAWSVRRAGPPAPPPTDDQPAPPAPPALAGRTLLQGPDALRAIAPPGPSSSPVVLDGAGRLWRIDGAGAGLLSLTRGPSGPAPGPGWLARAEGVLLWLDARRSLWSLRDGESEPRPLPLRDAALWKRPIGLASFGGALFVLDTGDGAGAGQVWRYAGGTGGGFDAPPQPWVQGSSAFLRNATGFAVDGDLWVARDDGSVVRLVNGRVEPFAPARLDAPIEHAGAVASGPAFKSLYVYDGGGRRLLQLSREGVLQGQVRDVAAAGDPAQGLWVDEGAGRALLLTEQRLQEVPLPAS